LTNKQNSYYGTAHKRLKYVAMKRIFEAVNASKCVPKCVWGYTPEPKPFNWNWEKKKNIKTNEKREITKKQKKKEKRKRKGMKR